jgi:S1-C subfamily serine protease
MTPHLPSAPATSAHLPDAVAHLARSVVGVVAGRFRHAASGCMWRDGTVVASAHAVGGARQLRVVLPTGEPAIGHVKGIDFGTDLAVLALDGGSTDVKPAEHATDAERRIGEFVFAVARDASGVASASFGHIGTVSGAWRSWRGGRIDRLLKLDGGLYPGFSGAPVADASGQAIGIATAALSRVYGIVVPVPTVDRVVAQLLERGRVAHGWLGIAVQPVRLTEAQTAALDIEPGAGLLVTTVADGSPAAAAGVLLGDTLVAIGGARVGSIDTLRDALGGDKIGARLRATLLRAGARADVTIEVGERAPSHCR